MSEKHAMPKVEIGDPVVWYTDGDRHTESCLGFVTRVGGLTLAINIITPDERFTRPIEGSYHIDDPRARGEHTRASGGWDYSPLLKRVMALEALMS